MDTRRKPGDSPSDVCWLPARRKPARQERVGRRLCRRLGRGLRVERPRLCRCPRGPRLGISPPAVFWRARYPRRAPVPPELPVSPARPYYSGDLSLPGAERADGTPAPPGAPLRLRSPRRSRRAGSAGSLGRARHHRHSRRAGKLPASPEPTARREPRAQEERPRRASSAPHCSQVDAVGSFSAPHSGQVFLISTAAGLKHMTVSSRCLFFFLPERAGPFRRQGIVEATLRTRSCRQGRS